MGVAESSSGEDAAIAIASSGVRAGRRRHTCVRALQRDRGEQKWERELGEQCRRAARQQGSKRSANKGGEWEK